MKSSRLWLAASIFALVLVISFIISVPHTRDVTEMQSTLDAAASVPVVTLRDSFKNGAHTITGSLEAPNACVTVTAEAYLTGDESGAESIRLALMFANDTGVCLQIPTRMDFKATVSAPSGLPITATVNGIAATTVS